MMLYVVIEEKINKRFFANTAAGEALKKKFDGLGITYPSEIMPGTREVGGKVLKALLVKRFGNDIFTALVGKWTGWKIVWTQNVMPDVEEDGLDIEGNKKIIRTEKVFNKTSKTIEKYLQPTVDENGVEQPTPDERQIWHYDIRGAMPLVWRRSENK